MADGNIARVFWTDDTHFTYAYYASADQTWHWITYDTADHSTAAISSPLKHDDSIWQQLDVLEPAPDAAIHGYISPTGRYAIYRISSGAPLESGKTEVWIADLEGHTRVKILEQDSCCYFVSSPAWFPDEKQVLFGFGYEGPVDLFIVDIQSGTPTSLSTIGDFTGTEFEWALSPDGRKLAVVDLQYNLLVVSLEDGTSRIVDQYSWQFTWSENSKQLYYWWQPSFEARATEIRIFDTTTADICTTDIDFYSNTPFTVSPHGNQVLFWRGRWLWPVRTNGCRDSE
jgi:Tol biopolymer transport system component